jgi:hypothetical protein
MALELLFYYLLSNEYYFWYLMNKLQIFQKTSILCIKIFL